MKRFCAIGDNHGDLISKRDEKAFLDFCADFKPHIRVHLGDNFDFRNLRRGVDPEEEMDDPEPDLTAGFMFLEKYKPTVLLAGNHDHRLWRMVGDTRGIVRKYARDGVAQIEKALKAIRCDFRPYDIERGVYELGTDTVCVHGYSCGLNAVRQHVLGYRKNVIMGHLHRNEVVAAQTLGGLSGMCVAGIGDHSRMSYSRQRFGTLGWGGGWSYGFLNERTGKTERFPMFREGSNWPKI